MRLSKAIRRALLLAPALTLLAFPLAAETRPRAFPEDPRIRWYSYDEHQVYRLDVFMRYITALQFAPGENVESVQVGDSASWQIVRLSRGDVLSVKPLIGGAFTNMTVFTDRRVYTFELRARSAPAGSPSVSYRISFRYPAEEAESRAAARKLQARSQDHAYFVAGEAERITPVEVHDDGQRTYFRFALDAPRPAVFAADATGREAIVNARQTGDGFVVDRVSRRWTLRLGDEVLCIAHGSVLDTVPDHANARPAGISARSLR